MKRVFIVVFLVFIITGSIFATTWESFNFVDEFGDETNNIGIKCVVEDSTRSTKYSTIRYTIVIEKCSRDNNTPYEISFKMNRDFYGDMIIKIKTSNDLIKEYRGSYNTCGRVYLNNLKDNNEIIELLKQEACHIIIISSTDKKYDFGKIRVSDFALSQISLH